jgi:hypothetical protein
MLLASGRDFEDGSIAFDPAEFQKKYYERKLPPSAFRSFLHPGASQKPFRAGFTY